MKAKVLKYFIGEIGFPTKKAVENFVRQTLITHGYGVVNIDNPIFDLIHNVLKNHCSYDEKKGAGIKYFIIQPNAMTGRDYTIMIKRTDDSIIDFSWVYCCEFKQRTQNADLTVAMREAISRDIYIFKQSNQLICNYCKETNLESQDFHVDHNEPPFRTIKDNFLKINKNHPLKFVDCPMTHRVKFQEEDKIFSKEWIDYHNKNCNLQILCKKCNLEKH